MAPVLELMAMAEGACRVLGADVSVPFIGKSVTRKEDQRLITGRVERDEVALQVVHREQGLDADVGGDLGRSDRIADGPLFLGRMEALADHHPEGHEQHQAGDAEAGKKADPAKGANDRHVPLFIDRFAPSMK